MHATRARLNPFLLCLAALTGCGDSTNSSASESGASDSGATGSTGASESGASESGATGGTGATEVGTATDSPTTTGSGECADDAPIVAVTNGTPWELAALQFAPCDATAVFETFPFPGMLAPGASFDVPLFGPDCYLLAVVELSGCELLEPVKTDQLAACEVFPLELSGDDFVCPGGLR